MSTDDAAGPAGPGIAPDPKKYPHLQKYFEQRHQYFSRFDEGCQLDEESWYSVTPEVIASHIAERTLCLCPKAFTILDAFSGAGGNAIQFALRFPRVIAIDIDPVKIECSRRNARIYGVEDRIEYINGDFLQLLPRLQADVLFLSPPWGGPDYAHYALFDVKKMMMYDGVQMFLDAQRLITPHIIYYVPRNVIPEQMTQLAATGGVCEFENNWLSARVKSVTCYYGDTVDYAQIINPREPPNPGPERRQNNRNKANNKQTPGSGQKRKRAP
eukprot:TRINITY_DN66979_c0_g1_i1.p1 TRINITY_DN66979_c0_g1~~TRINITY_DN66979_c0_g1_i1.p1  ORF type:complete len:271 (-),score=64.00 TRINITY_DN66979_c0_g1_i1:51-863(-)